MKRTSNASFPAVALTAVLSATACTSHPAALEAPAASRLPDAATALSVESWPGLRQPRSNLVTGGQPEPEAWQTMAAQGVTTVVNLRPEVEMGGRDEAAEVAAAGMDYHRIAIAGAGDLSAANASALWNLLARAPGTVAVHCASGNRVGALLALGAATHGGMTADQAVAFGRQAGLGTLEPQVRERLGLPPAD